MTLKMKVEDDAVVLTDGDNKIVIEERVEAIKLAERITRVWGTGLFPGT